MGTPSSLDNELSQRTFIFGLRLWVIIGIGVGAFIVLMLLFLSVCLTSRKRSEEMPKKLPSYMIPTVSKEIKEVKVDILQNADTSGPPESMLHSVSKNPEEKSMKKNVGETSPNLTIDEGKENPQVERGSLLQKSRFEIANRANSPIVDPPAESIAHPPAPNPVLPEVSHLGWGHWYTLRDLEAATNYFSDGNVIGEGGYGIVYRGQLPDGALIAVKNLLNNRGQAEREFRVEVEAIGRVRHKNLVRLLGYCVEGFYRMLVYEYVANGNLEQWLHGHLGEHQSFPWEMRMKIMLGTAKGLAYLHEGLEPKVVHRDVKASNILLDGQWNAKVSDFGLAKLLGSEKSHVTTRVMGTFGYVAPEYASTGLLNERSDVYSFGVLLMEVITGRDPVDYDRPVGEVNLVDWLKMMVASRHSEEVADPKLEVRPSSRALKRALLVALRCVDPDSLKRPKMGQVIHMLEADDFPFHDERRVPRNVLRAKADSPDELLHSQSRDGSSHKGN